MFDVLWMMEDVYKMADVWGLMDLVIMTVDGFFVFISVNPSEIKRKSFDTAFG